MEVNKMAYWTEKDDNSKIAIVQVVFGDVFLDIGRVEKPYSNLEKYYATGWDHEELGNNGSYFFTSFEEAEQRIIKHYQNEMEVLNK
jgi:hypothetical protein